MEAEKKVWREVMRRGAETQKVGVLFTNYSEVHQVGPGCLDKPVRMKMVLEYIKEAGMKNVEIVGESQQAPARIVKSVHSSEYVDRLVRKAKEAGEEPKILEEPAFTVQPSYDVNKTWVQHGSLIAATSAAGLPIHGVELIKQGKMRRVVCVTRPPGSHVGRNGVVAGATSQGYGLLNNVGIGVAHAKEAGYQKVGIVDLDATYPNGTAEIVEKEAGVYLGSVTSECSGPFDFVTGGKEGSGNVYDVKVRSKAKGEEWLEAVDKVLGWMKLWEPEILFLSIGFNGHTNDPTRLMELTQQDYGVATAKVVRFAEENLGGRVVSVVEGGYDITSRGRESFVGCFAAHMEALATGIAPKRAQARQPVRIPPPTQEQLQKLQIPTQPRGLRGLAVALPVADGQGMTMLTRIPHTSPQGVPPQAVQKLSGKQTMVHFHDVRPAEERRVHVQRPNKEAEDGENGVVKLASSNASEIQSDGANEIIKI